MERIEIPGLHSFESRETNGFYEIGYATGDDTFPLARVRILPVRDHEPRASVLNAPPAPPRIRILVSASLVDDGGQVLRVAGQLLVGNEGSHSHQLEPGQNEEGEAVLVPFNPAAWIDAVAATTISALLHWARGVEAAAASGLLAPPQTVPRLIAPPIPL